MSLWPRSTGTSTPWPTLGPWRPGTSLAVKPATGSAAAVGLTIILSAGTVERPLTSPIPRWRNGRSVPGISITSLTSPLPSSSRGSALGANTLPPVKDARALLAPSTALCRNRWTSTLVRDPLRPESNLPAAGGRFDQPDPQRGRGQRNRCPAGQLIIRSSADPRADRCWSPSSPSSPRRLLAGSR